jgi:UDP-3-O-[3-hydroxymyristoyl] glucosamine N-acyltransferase
MRGSYHAVPGKASNPSDERGRWPAPGPSDKRGGMKLTELARTLGCELRGDGDVEIAGVAPIEDAAPGTLTFLADRRLATKLADCRAAAVVLPPDAADVAIPSLRAPHPYVAFVAAVELLHPAPPRPPAGIHPTAVIDPGARLGAGRGSGPTSSSARA